MGFQLNPALLNGQVTEKNINVVCFEKLLVERLPVERIEIIIDLSLRF